MAKPFSPQTLRGILTVVLITAISGSAGLFYSGLKDVQAFATEVNATVAQADASGADLQNLQTLKSQLAQSQELIAKANQLFTTPANAQNQATNDINAYASAAGLKVTKLNFEQSATIGTEATMTVGIKAPVSYSKLINFLNGIEGNLPKMQVSSISISHQDGGSSDSVVVDDIKIMIATR